MSVPTAELTTPAAPARWAAPSLRTTDLLDGGRFYVALGGVALVIAALSLLIPSTPSYDPWAWLVWGHEVIHLDLQTTGGPSWKPLPMLFTTVFALFGKAQPDLWLVIARAGAVMTVVMAFRLAWRLTQAFAVVPAAVTGAARLWVAVPPLLAGVIAAGSLINSSGFVSDNALGYSEGLATALVLIAFERHLLGARRQAFAVGFFAALDRPELWFFWGPYGLYLFWRDPGARRLVVALFALIPVLWFLPELWGSGHLLRGVNRAQHPRSNSAAFTSCPVCTVFRKEAWIAVLNRVKVPAIIAMAVAVAGLWRTRDTWRHGSLSAPVKARIALIVIGVFGFVWWLGIAVETQAGFSGNNRYLVLGTAPVAIAGGVAWGWFIEAVAGLLSRLALSERARSARRLAAQRFALPAATFVGVALFLAVPPWIGHNVVSIPRVHRALVYQARLRTGMTAAIRKAGGRSALLGCGSIMTEGFQVPMAAWNLGVPTARITATPLGLVGAPWPNVLLQNRAQSNSTLLPLPEQIAAWERAGAHYRLIVHNRTFRVFTTCSAKGVG
ncbi:MAG: hypothetical protein JO168_00140 [Solirubrobacterales bacterium]|nr:hypothetical protein [Solirubrobacterales bacterium]